MDKPRFLQLMLPLARVELLCCIVTRLDRWSYANLSVPHWRLYYHDRPGAFVVWQRERIALPARRPILVPPETSMASEVESSEDPVTQLFIHFVLLDPLWSVEPGVHLLAPSAEFSRLAEPILASTTSRHGTAHESFQFTQAVLACVASLPPAIWLKRTSDRRIEAVVSFVGEHLQEELSNQQLAAVARMSKRNFTRTFADEMGRTPRQYVLQKRLDRAVLLLEHTDQSVDEVCEACGFADRAYFTRVFSKKWGIPPGQYRRTRRWDPGLVV